MNKGRDTGQSRRKESSYAWL